MNTMNHEPDLASSESTGANYRNLISSMLSASAGYDARAYVVIPQ